MPRTRDLSLVNRDAEIIAMVAEGKYSYAQVSEKFGVSKARISQIVQRYYEELPDDGSRDVQRAKLEKAQEMMFAIMTGPGKRVVSPGGSPVFERFPDGTIDYDHPLYDEEIRIKAALAGVTIAERLAKSFAWDRPKQKEKDESSEYAEALAYMHDLADKNKEKDKQLELLQQRLEEIEGSQDIVEAEVVEDG
jgi:hypothetical protein